MGKINSLSVLLGTKMNVLRSTEILTFVLNRIYGWPLKLLYFSGTSLSTIISLWLLNYLYMFMYLVDCLSSAD